MIKQALQELVRTSVGEAIYGPLDEKTKALTNAEIYERAQADHSCRAGHCEASLQAASVG